MGDAGIALLVIAIIVVIAVVLAILIRVFGIYQWNLCFATSEEKAGLTKHEQYNGYMVSQINPDLTDICLVAELLIF